jgi:hypothetical protein
VLTRQRDERLAGVHLHVGGIDHREPRVREPASGDELQHREGVFGRGLVVLVIGDQPAAEVRGEHLAGFEVPAGERALAGAARADQYDEAGLGELDPHRSNTAICVGGPTSGSSGPTGRKRTP